MSKGTITYYNNEKGEGLICDSLTGENIDFHIRDWKNPCMPCGNDDVEFQTAYGKESKLKAVNIILRKSNTAKIEETSAKREENLAKNADRINCPGCNKKIIPRIITNKSIAKCTMCPYCGTVIKRMPMGYCYIATAVYQDYNHPKVIILRKFRDNYLLTNKFGKKFVEFYYKNSPNFADYIKNKKVISYLIRKTLDCFSFLLQKYFIK